RSYYAQRNAWVILRVVRNPSQVRFFNSRMPGKYRAELTLQLALRFSILFTEKPHLPYAEILPVLHDQNHNSSVACNSKANKLLLGGAAHSSPSNLVTSIFTAQLAWQRTPEFLGVLGDLCG